MSDRDPRAAVKDAVRRSFAHAGVAAGDRLVIGCSHGPDSLCLADAVLSLAPQLGLGEITLAYVDHGLRGAEDTGSEARAVAALAAARGAHFRRVAVTVGRTNGRGLEDAARRARHAALAEVADQAGARWILLGHTASDQAETVLMRLLRGAGVVGLAGIPSRRGRILRPLLQIDRAEVLAYLAAAGLEPSHDRTNDDPAFLRNRVRHTWLPSLARENPRLARALGRTAQAMREQAEVLDWAAQRALSDAVLSRSGATVRLSVAALVALPAAVAKRLLFRLAGELGTPLEARHLDALLDLAAGPAAGTRALDLPGLPIRREYDTLVLGTPQDPPPPRLDVEGPGGPFRVRPAAPGDRMRPARLKGRSRKLQDLYVDARVPLEARRRALVVVREADGALVWAQHLGHAWGVNVRVRLTNPESVVIDERSSADRLDLSSRLSPDV